jgi:hypothetical protein
VTRFPEDQPQREWWYYPLRAVSWVGAGLAIVILVIVAVAIIFNLCRWAFVQVA